MKIAIVGAGGHAKEVYHSILEKGQESLIDGFYVDPKYLREGISTLYDIPIKCIEELDIHKHLIHIAVGETEFRAKAYQSFKSLGFNFVTVIDPRAIVPKTLGSIGEGSYLAPNSTITTDVKIGKCVIINTGAIISHDCEINDFSTISPGAIICGNVIIGERTFIGAGSVIREKLWICEGVLLGMGSVVIRSILEPGTYIIHDKTIKKLTK